VVLFHHRLNMELDLQSLFGLHVHSCTHWLKPRNSPLPPHFGSFTRALLVSQDRRHIFVTPCIPQPAPSILLNPRFLSHSSHLSYPFLHQSVSSLPSVQSTSPLLTIIPFSQLSCSSHMPTIPTIISAHPHSLYSSN
jgi:hypothetical protein